MALTTEELLISGVSLLPASAMELIKRLKVFGIHPNETRSAICWLVDTGVFDHTLDWKLCLKQTNTTP